MAGRLDTSGEIETLFHDSSQIRKVEVGDRVLLVFRPRDQTDHSVQILVTSPSGQRIVERVLREIPTGLPQSAPPVDFVPAAKGEYIIEIREVRGSQRGHATLKVD